MGDRNTVFSHENRERLIGATKDVYHITILFPKKEPLRYRMRDVADEILAAPKEADFEILDRFFEVAKDNNWVSPSEILAIQSEYADLRRLLGKEEPKEISQIKKNISAAPPQKLDEKLERTERQEKIVSFLKDNERAQVWEVKKIFPEVSKRTLRRDFEFLLKEGVIKRIGERNNTFYQIKV